MNKTENIIKIEQEEISNEDLLNEFIKIQEENIEKWNEHQKEHIQIEVKLSSDINNIKETVEKCYLEYAIFQKEKESFNSFTLRLQALETEVKGYRAESNTALKELKDYQKKSDEKIDFLHKCATDELKKKAKEYEEIKKLEEEKYRNIAKTIAKRILSFSPLIISLIATIMLIHSKINESLKSGLIEVDKRFSIYEKYADKREERMEDLEKEIKNISQDLSNEKNGTK